MKNLNLSFWCFQLLPLQCLPIASDLALQYNSATNIRRLQFQTLAYQPFLLGGEASMNLLNVFRKNKYYEQFCLKRLYKSHVIELIWRKANRSRRGPGHTIIVDYFVENRERCLKRAAPIWVCTIFVCLLVLHHLLIHPNQLGSGKLFVRGAAEDLGASEAFHNLALK